MVAVLVGCGAIGYNSERGPPKDHFIKKIGPNWLSRRFLNIFPIGSNVKIMSAVLVGGQDHWIQF